MPLDTIMLKLLDYEMINAAGINPVIYTRIPCSW